MSESGGEPYEMDVMGIRFHYGSGALEGRQYVAIAVPLAVDGSEAAQDQWIPFGTITSGMAEKAPDLCREWELLMAKFIARACENAPNVDCVKLVPHRDKKAES